MVWTSLQSSLGGKALVLAGPILRKVTPQSATVWLALRKPASVRIIVLDDHNVLTMEGTYDAVAVGKNLYIVAVTAKLLPGKSRLAEGVVYQYQLTFDLGNNSTTPLQADVMTKGARLAYPPFSYPSFALPPTSLNYLRVLQGSCRMPHGQGDDTMTMIDDLIAATADNAFARPHQLLLTGDQIYADDVSDALLMTLIDAADVLLGWQENIPRIYPGSRWDSPIPAGMRATVLGSPGMGKLQVTPGFTSDDLRSHLMSLGEYLSMYLFVWSDVLWPDVMPSFDQVANEIYSRVPREHAWAEEFYPPKHKDEIEADMQRVALFSQKLSKVRCALANIPTYMIFDDHEVTDDWNITRNWCKTVYKNQLGLRVLQNALTAYALCQHWGNAPEQFEALSTKPGRVLLNLLDSPVSRLPGVPRDVSNAASLYDQNSEDIRKLLGVHDESALSQRTHGALYHDANSLRYDFTVEGDGHQIIFTDTRTWRSFPNGGDEAPHLLTKDQFTQQILNAPNTGNRALLVVLTTNAPPLQQDRLKYKYDYLITSDIYDAWLITTAPFDRLLATLTEKLPVIAGERQGSVIILSGDSHWSFCSRISYWADNRTEDTQTRRARAVIAQLVASPFKKTGGHSLGFHREGYEYDPYVLGGGNERENFPDHRYSLDYLLPTRQEIQLDVPPITPSNGSTLEKRLEAANSYKTASQINRKYNKTNEAKIVGRNNFGEINFEVNYSDYYNRKVIHTLRWWEPGSSSVRLTTFVVNLNPLGVGP
jgi:hypothetical protein